MTNLATQPIMDAFDTTEQTGTHPLSHAPITLIQPGDVMPRRYVVHKHSQHCRNCGSVHEWAAVYACNELYSRTGSGKLVLHLVPVEGFRFNLPVQVVSTKRNEVPVCHECPDRLNLSHLPDPRATEEWKRIYSVGTMLEPAKPGTKRPANISHKPTIDDL